MIQDGDCDVAYIFPATTAKEDAQHMAAAEEMLQALEHVVSEMVVKTDGEHSAYLNALNALDMARGVEH